MICITYIDSELRHFFLEDRELLGLLFEAVQSVILRMFHKDNKTEKFTPGFILVLHTFGRDLKWNQYKQYLYYFLVSYDIHLST